MVKSRSFKKYIANCFLTSCFLPYWSFWKKTEVIWVHLRIRYAQLMVSCFLTLKSSTPISTIC